MPSPVYRGDNPGFQTQAVGNYPDASDVADKDNIFLTDQGWVYRHFKSLDKSEFWDEIIWAGDVTNPPAGNDPVDAMNDPAPEFLTGDGIQFVSGPYPSSSSSIGTVVLGNADSGDTATAIPFVVSSIGGALAATDTWKWTVTGPGVATVSNATGAFTGNTLSQANTNITFPTVGQYTVKVELVSVSGDGLTSTGTQGFGAEANVTPDTIGTVTVSGQTTPLAGAGLTYTATYTGTAPEGDVTYTWSATPSSGVTIASIGDKNQERFIFTSAASVTSTVIKCTITDGSASDSPQEGTLTVVPHFEIGAVSITGPTTLTNGVQSTVYSISGYTGQSNPPPNDLTYAWTANAAGSFDDATSATPRFTPSAVGGVQISCIVSSAKSDPTSSPKSNVISASVAA